MDGLKSCVTLATCYSHHEQAVNQGWTERHPVTTGLLLFGAVLGVYLLTGGYTAQSVDTDAASTAAWNYVRAGTLDLSEIELADNPWFVKHEGGIYSNRFPGTILYSVPFYVASEAIGLSDRWTPGVVAAAFTAAAAVLAMWQLLRIDPSTKPYAIPGALLFAFGTATWTVSADAQWPHTIDQLLIVLGLLALARSRLAAAGLLFGLQVLARPQMAPSVLFIGLTRAFHDRSWRSLLIFGGPALMGATLLFAYNQAIFGQLSYDSGTYVYAGPSALTDLPVNALGTLVDPQRGILLMYPSLVILLTVAPRAWTHSPRWITMGVIGAGVALLTQLALNRYSGGDSFFGSRLTLEPLTLTYPYLVVCWSQLSDRARIWAYPLIGLSVTIHAFGAIAYPHTLAGDLTFWQSAAVAAGGIAVVGLVVTLAQRYKYLPDVLGGGPERPRK